jgi:hypothetical protein
MKKYTATLLTIATALILTGCQPSYTAEMTIPLIQSDAENEKTKSVDVYDVLAEVEKIASRGGLKPYTAPSEEINLLDLADTDNLTDSAVPTNPTLTRTFKHPDCPLYLSFTRQSEEIILVLNTPTPKPAKDEANLYNTLHKQLTTELPEHLNITIIQQTQE